MAPVFIVEPTEPHLLTVIFLHGRGGSGPDFARDVMQTLNSQGKNLIEVLPFVRWMFPTSRRALSTRYQWMWNEWFDVWNLRDPAKKEELAVPGLCSSIRKIHALLDEEIARIGADRVVLAGISQGCATGIHALWSYGHKLAGFAGMLGWLPFQSAVQAATAAGARDTAEGRLVADFYIPAIGLSEGLRQREMKAHETSIFLAHVKDDEKIRPSLSVQLEEAARELQMPLEAVAYERGGHWLHSPTGIDDLEIFLLGLVPDSD